MKIKLENLPFLGNLSPIKDLMKSAKAGDLEPLSIAAHSGDVEAQYYLGAWYARSTPEDLEQAVYWWAKAAASWHVEAQYWLGICYVNGFGGLAKDQVIAMRWWLKASAAGNANAYEKLGICYYNGIGSSSKNVGSAIQCWAKAASLGDVKAQMHLDRFVKNADAQYRLGIAYFVGKVLPKDLDKAQYWLGKSAMQGHIDAQYMLGNYYSCVRSDDGIDKMVFWYTKAAVAGHADAQYKLGLYYVNGRYKQRNVQKAVHWWYKASVQNQLDAAYYFKKYSCLRDMLITGKPLKEETPSEKELNRPRAGI